MTQPTVLDAPSLMDRQQAASDRINVQPHSGTTIVRLTVQAPDLENQDGAGKCTPDSVDLVYDRYEDGRRVMHAIVYGSWRRQDGQLTEARVTCRYTGTPDEWPDWVAGLVYDYHPEPHTIGQQAAACGTEETTRRILTPGEYDAAWHAVEGAAGEPGADPGTVLSAVLDRLGIQPPPTA